MKSSTSIALVLIGSAAILLACEGCSDRPQQQTGQATTQPAHRGHGWFWWGGASRAASRSGIAGRSSRGGFGRSGFGVGS